MADAFPSISFLIPELSTGNEPAWNELFNKFREGLAGKARQLLRRNKLEKRFSPDDLVQETYIKAWNRHATFMGQTTSQFASWILTIMKNTFRDWYRSFDEADSLTTWFDFPDRADTPSVVLMSHERESALLACLAELSPKASAGNHLAQF